jgi:hypothetical protein
MHLSLYLSRDPVAYKHVYHLSIYSTSIKSSVCFEFNYVNHINDYNKHINKNNIHINKDNKHINKDNNKHFNRHNSNISSNTSNNSMHSSSVIHTELNLGIYL